MTHNYIIQLFFEGVGGKGETEPSEPPPISLLFIMLSSPEATTQQGPSHLQIISLACMKAS